MLTAMGHGLVQGNKEASHPKRRKVTLPEAEPTVEEVEAEFWRIVESPDQVRYLQLCHFHHSACQALQVSRAPCSMDCMTRGGCTSAGTCANILLVQPYACLWDVCCHALLHIAFLAGQIPAICR